MTKFQNQTLVEIHSTGNQYLDGLHVRVVGIACDAGPVGGTIYIIKRARGWFPTNYECMTLTESCLKLVSENA